MRLHRRRRRGRYNDLAPRVAFAYDLRGTGQTVIKASAARYYGLGIYTAGSISPTGQTTLVSLLERPEQRLVRRRNEIDFARGFRRDADRQLRP